MPASATRRKIDQVLAAACKDLEAQLRAVRAEVARLTAEEEELTRTLASLGADGAPAPSTARSRTGGASRPSRTPATRRSARKRARSRSAGGKSTAERLEELRTVLAGGPKPLKELAAELKVSPPRVQQLLSGLGDSVSWQQNPGGPGKLWSIEGGGDGSGTSHPEGGERPPATEPSPVESDAGKGAASK